MGERIIEVSYSDDFQKKLKNFPKADQLKIRRFIEHLEQFGFVGLQGRNKSSDNVPTDHLNWLERVKYAQQHKLWHYHIGIPYYETANNGEQVSEYLLHYIRDDNAIKLVALSYHPPFELPTESEMR